MEKQSKLILEEKEINKGEKIFVVEYKNNEKHIKEIIVEKEVQEIWEKVKKQSEKLNLDEAVIKYEYLIGKNKQGEPVYEGILFNAEKIENGTWKITKVN